MDAKTRDRLIVALDFPTVKQAEALVGRLGSGQNFYKVGLQLLFAPGGMAFAERLAKGKQVFVDGKFLDIDNTVGGAVGSVVAMGAALATVHAYPQAMRAAVKARGASRLKLLAVTVLTSMDDADLAEAGYGMATTELVLRRAKQAKAAGMDGIVASPAEAAAIRAEVGRDMLIVTPGIRLATGAAGDQKRLATPEAAIRAGADYLVVGRPISEAAEPIDVVQAILAEMVKPGAARREGQ